MFSKNIFAERVRTLRLSKNLRQLDIGQAIGISAQAINDIESGRRTTSFENLVKLAECFDVSTDYLLGCTDDKTKHW